MKKNDLAVAAGKLTNFMDPLKIYKQQYDYKEQIMNYSPQPSKKQAIKEISNGSQITDYTD